MKERIVPSPTPLRHRRADKRQQVLSALRGSIVDGRYRPGERIPTRVELLETFDVSTLTLQKALDQLGEEGFLVSRGRSGTFVTEKPPHLGSFGIVFRHPDTPETPWPRFWHALAAEATRRTHLGAARFTPYYSMNGRRETPEYRTLRRVARTHLARGLLFCYAPTDLLDSSILRESTSVCVAIGRVEHPQVSQLLIDASGFIRRSLDWLQRRKRKRIALLTGTTTFASERELTLFKDELARRGMKTRSWWQQALDVRSPAWAKPYAELLGRSDDRPDGLIIANDNLVEHACAGLASAGVRVPEQMDVVAHCNFPWATPSLLPVQRLGYDARDVLDTFLELAGSPSARKPKRHVRTIEARFEHELERNETPTDEAL